MFSAESHRPTARLPVGIARDVAGFAGGQERHGGGDVGAARAVAAAPGQPGRRAGEDDGAAAPLLDHQRRGGVDGVPGADEFDVERVVERPARVGVLHDPDAGVRKRDVDATELLCAICAGTCPNGEGRLARATLMQLQRS